MGEEPHQVSVGALGALAARADRAAFDELHRRLGASLRGVLGRRGLSPADAEELAQRAWAGAWEACAAGRFDPTRAAFSTFLFAIAHKLWVNRFRGRQSPAGPLDGAEPIDAADAIDERELAESVDMLRRVLRGDVGDLSDRERLAARLAATGTSDRELGLRLGVAPSTAHVTKQSAYAKIRRILARRGLAERAERNGASDE